MKKEMIITADPKEVVLQFNEYINAQNPTGLSALMTDDHALFDDGLTIQRGKEKVLDTWRQFFSLFPDYRNVFERIESRDDLVVISGYSVCSDDRLNGPALWTAKVNDNKITEWRIYEDTLENRKRLDIRSNSL